MYFQFHPVSIIATWDSRLRSPGPESPGLFWYLPVLEEEERDMVCQYILESSNILTLSLLLS